MLAEGVEAADAWFEGLLDGLRPTAYGMITFTIIPYRNAWR